MIPITFYVFLSVIIMPDGTVKSYTENVVECPTEEAVQQMHVPKMKNGTIKDWAASCGPMTLMFNEPPTIPNKPSKEELQT
tara:strand:+ start:438 stop:680 length:243 start_codon:yes stop_codon:yes gene_type:complete